MRSAARGRCGDASSPDASAILIGPIRRVRLTMLLTGTYQGASSIYVPVCHMAISQSRPFGQRYAFVVVAVIFLALLVAAALRSSMSVMMVPLEDAFGWRRDSISFAAAIGIFLYGLVGPFAAALMERVGLRRTVIGALVLMSAATALSLLMSKPWHLIAT